MADTPREGGSGSLSASSHPRFTLVFERLVWAQESTAYPGIHCLQEGPPWSLSNPKAWNDVEYEYDGHHSSVQLRLPVIKNSVVAMPFGLSRGVHVLGAGIHARLHSIECPTPARTVYTPYRLNTPHKPQQLPIQTLWQQIVMFAWLQWLSRTVQDLMQAHASTYRRLQWPHKPMNPFR